MNRCNLCANSYFMLHRFITPSRKSIDICLRCYVTVTNPLLK